LDILVPEVVLDLAHILAPVGEREAAAMSQHMRVQVRQVATLACPLHQSPDLRADLRLHVNTIEIYLRQARNFENEMRAIEIRIRAERRCGELLAEMEKARRATRRQPRKEDPEVGGGSRGWAIARGFHFLPHPRPNHYEPHNGRSVPTAAIVSNTPGFTHRLGRSVIT
jgi:hypothetical protein